MIIRRKEIEIQFLALQTLKLCPSSQGAEFNAGFSAFVECFFQDLDYCSDAFTDRNGHFDVELSVVLDLSLGTVESFLKRMPLEQRKNYWLGVMASVEASEQTLKFAFEVVATNEAA